MLRIRHYNLESKLINENLRIVNITDVHSDVKRLESALNYADSINADLITIVGDLFDSVDNKNNETIVKLLGKQRIRTLISIGNHDLISFDRKGFFAKVHKTQDMKYFDALKTYDNITILSDNKEMVNFKGIEIIGFDPGYSWYFEKREEKGEFNRLLNRYLKQYKKNNKFRIMLLHSCNGLIDNNELKHSIENVNLVLSGHNHAGQMPDMFQKFSKYNRGIIGPFEKPFMKGCYGYWSNYDTSVILSNGLTKMGDSHGPKWLCSIMNNALKDDIEVINIKNGSKHNLILDKKELKEY